MGPQLSSVCSVSCLLAELGEVREWSGVEFHVAPSHEPANQRVSQQGHELGGGRGEKECGGPAVDHGGRQKVVFSVARTPPG